jgi:hypothetical protein
LDPFCGTGTTLLACAEQGIGCQTIDVNPFLCWLAKAKCASYSSADLRRAEGLVDEMARAAGKARGEAWAPPLHRIERWWDARTLAALSRAFDVLGGKRGKARDLAALAFCRTLVDAGNVSFRHQSMSFGARSEAPDVPELLRGAYGRLATGARDAVQSDGAKALLGDSRKLPEIIQKSTVGCVITSPPYVNRMSYIRELRPYMYWLGFLRDGRHAGELDWQAIGGTWGIATSKLSSWATERPLELERLRPLVRKISKRSDVLGRYVERYFCDMDEHVRGLSQVLARGGRAHYVVGNSKFFDVVVPAERLFADLFELHGLTRVKVDVLRRRTSKKELFEYLVSGERR